MDLNNNQVGTAANPIDPRIEPLANNGGPTLTHNLLSDSPAIDTGDAPQTLANDQRGPGFLRVFDGQADIGSLETQPDPQIRNNIYVTASGPGPMPW